jgi:hypothetical protein
MEAHLEENVKLVREERGPRHHAHHPCSAFRAPATLKRRRTQMMYLYLFVNPKNKVTDSRVLVATRADTYRLTLVSSSV